MALTRLALERAPFANGRPFGVAGEYEQLLGTATFGVDPRHAANACIVDLDLAPRDADGRVYFDADVRILQPRDRARANRRLVLDVVNRGNPVAIRNTELGVPRMPEADSQGWLLQQGYTIVSCGWQHNVPTGTPRLGLRAPEALDHGQSLTGQVRAIVQVNTPTNRIGVADEPSPVEHVAYPVADLTSQTDTLAELDFPLAPRRSVPRDRWRFETDRAHVVFDDGFKPGKIYEVLYTARGAAVTGVGFAALRDAVSFLRFASSGDGNPCAGMLDFALAFGGSQTGRLLRHLLYLGMYADEDRRLVLDGVLAHIAGPLRTEANWRFGQPSFIGSDSPGFAFPFSDVTQTDPLSGATDGLLRANDDSSTMQPKVMHVNTSAEYVNLDLALIHMTADQRADVQVPDNVRIYHLAGTHHGGGSLPLDNRVFSSVAAYYNNSIDYRPLVRAAFANLDAWATRGTSPPDSAYPRFSDGTLIPRATLVSAAARLPGPGVPPERLYPTQRLDYGPEAGLGRARFPAVDGGSYPDYVPAVDGDGNEVSGVRHPDVAVPLGSYTGWNPRDASIGGSEMNLLLNGATIPFATTRVLRETWGDARPSIEERYASREAFLARVRVAATSLSQTRYLLESDIDEVVAASARRYDEFVQLQSPLP
jgi:hypothetical protein